MLFFAVLNLSKKKLKTLDIVYMMSSLERKATTLTQSQWQTKWIPVQMASMTEISAKCVYKGIHWKINGNSILMDANHNQWIEKNNDGGEQVVRPEAMRAKEDEGKMCWSGHGDHLNVWEVSVCAIELQLHSINCPWEENGNNHIDGCSSLQSSTHLDTFSMCKWTHYKSVRVCKDKADTTDTFSHVDEWKERSSEWSFYLLLLQQGHH